MEIGISGRGFRGIVVLTMLGIVQSLLPSLAAQHPAHEEAIQYRLDRLVFNGLMTIGNRTTLSIFDPSTEASLWIPLGGSSAGLQVSRYSSSKDTIVVTYMGLTKEITLRNPTIAPIDVKTPPPKPEKYVVPKSDKIIMEEERARMMVTDILAVGMKERARRKAERAAEKRKAEAEKRARIKAQTR